VSAARQTIIQLSRTSRSSSIYNKAQAAAAVPFEASQAEGMPQVIERAKKLRAACDGCHAKYMHVEAAPNP